MRWRSVASLVCLAAGCSAALRTRRLSSLACLTSVCCDLRFWSLWHRRCSLEVALPIAQDTFHLSHSVLHVCKIVSVRKYSLYGRTGHLHASHNAVTLPQARPNYAQYYTGSLTVLCIRMHIYSAMSPNILCMRIPAQKTLAISNRYV